VNLAVNDKCKIVNENNFARALFPTHVLDGQMKIQKYKKETL